MYVPLPPANINDMKDQMPAVINMADRDMLWRVLEEFSYRLDVLHAACGGHIEHL